MKIRIEVKPIGPLKLLREFPDYRLAVLEGMNGIGKTLAVRLLEACTGTLPYAADSSAWQSLCAGVGPFTVKVEDVGPHSVVLRGDTRDWTGVRVASELSFSEVAIDGNRVTPERVRRLFVVRRLAGDETLVETFARQAEGYRIEVDRWREQIAPERRGPLSRMEELAANALKLTGGWDAKRYSELAARVREAEAQHVRSKKEAAATRARLQKVGEAYELRERTDKILRDGPDAQAQLRAIVDKMEEAKQQLAEANRRIEEIAAEAARSADALKRLTEARKAANKHRTNLTKKTDAAAELAAELNIEFGPDACDLAASEIHSRVLNLKLRLVEHRKVPSMERSLGAAEAALAEAETAGFGTELAIHLPKAGISLTVSQARDGLRRTRATYAGWRDVPETKQLETELARAEARERRIHELQLLYKNISRQRTGLRSNQERADQILASANPQARDEQDQLNARRNALFEELTDLGGRHSLVKHKLSLLEGESLSEMTERLEQIASDLSIPQDGIAAAFEKAKAEEEAARVSAERWKEEAARLKLEQDVLMTAARSIARLLVTSDDHRWLGKALGPTDHLSDGAPIEAALAVIERASRYAFAVTDRLGNYRNRLAAVSGALGAVATRLRGGPVPSEQQLNVREAEAWLNRKFSEWFNHERVREELLENATHVSVDVRQREVQWMEGQTALSRPLDAFSSGEQAFAYTRARLALLDDTPGEPPHRLIVLDEFGAFIAHNRLATLFTHLRERVERSEDDQFLVILPLTRDYEAEAESATKPRRDWLLQQAQNVRDRSYTVRKL